MPPRPPRKGKEVSNFFHARQPLTGRLWINTSVQREVIFSAHVPVLTRGKFAMKSVLFVVCGWKVRQRCSGSGAEAQWGAAREFVRRGLLWTKREESRR
jgi:hypothetical protein